MSRIIMAAEAATPAGVVVEMLVATPVGVVTRVEEIPAVGVEVKGEAKAVGEASLN